jgi:hypothetical protein
VVGIRDEDADRPPVLVVADVVQSVKPELPPNPRPLVVGTDVRPPLTRQSPSAGQGLFGRDVRVLR